MKPWFWAKRNLTRQHGEIIQATLESIKQTQEETSKILAAMQHWATTIGVRSESQLKRLEFSNKAIRELLEPEGTWRRLATRGPFFSPGLDEARRPFLVPFDPDHQMLLWVADSFIPHASFGLIVPRTCAKLVPVWKKVRGEVGDMFLNATEQGKTNLGEVAHIDTGGEIHVDESEQCLALVIDGQIAPQGWREAIHALTKDRRNGVWLVKFAEEQPSNATAPDSEDDHGLSELQVRVMITPRLPPGDEPEPGPDISSNGGEILYFAGTPAQELVYPFPKVQVAPTAS